MIKTFIVSITQGDLIYCQGNLESKQFGLHNLTDGQVIQTALMDVMMVTDYDMITVKEL